MIKRSIVILSLALLTACQSAPSLEQDNRYVRLSVVVDIHEYTEIERRQAQANQPSDTRVGMGISIGGGSGGSFGGMMFGLGNSIGGQRNNRDQPPDIANGATRYTVQPLGSTERIEVMSREKHNMGDCVKVLIGHPSEFPRFFALKPGGHCE